MIATIAAMARNLIHRLLCRRAVAHLPHERQSHQSLHAGRCHSTVSARDRSGFAILAAGLRGARQCNMLAAMC